MINNIIANKINRQSSIYEFYLIFQSLFKGSKIPNTHYLFQICFIKIINSIAHRSLQLFQQHKKSNRII